MDAMLDQLKAALDNTAFVASLDSAGHIVEVNSKFIQALGKASSAIVGCSFSQFFSDEMPAVLKNEILATMAKGTPWKGQIRHATKSGRPLWVEASIQPIRGQQDEVAGFIFIAFDITEQKAVHEALYNNKLFLRKLMASAPVGFFLADGSGECELINSKWSQMSGLNLRQAAGSGWLKAVHPEDRPRVAKAWSELLSSGTGFQMEFRYRKSSGDEIPVLAAASILRDAATAESRVLRVEQDLTIQKQSEEIINSHKAQMIATSKLTSLGEMSSSIAHEINNPLAAILGGAELLKTTLENTPPDLARIDRMADTIMKNTLRIAKIIKSLRLISRDADNDPTELKELSAIFSDTLEMCAAAARLQQTEIRVPHLDPEVTVLCKPAQITQTLLALLKNALMAVEDAKERWIHLDVKELDSQVEIWITDSGPGIPEKNREKIFQPFFTTAPIGKGTGLGLSVAKGVVEKNNGTLRLDDSCVNTRFIIALPKG